MFDCNVAERPPENIAYWLLRYKCFILSQTRRRVHAIWTADGLLILNQTPTFTKTPSSCEKQHALGALF